MSTCDGPTDSPVARPPAPYQIFFIVSNFVSYCVGLGFRSGNRFSQCFLRQFVAHLGLFEPRSVQYQLFQE